MLLEAKRRGILTERAAEIDRLQRLTSFRIRPEVRQQVLGLAGES